MVAYIASQTLSHTEIVPEEEEGGSIWDTLTQRSSGRQARPTATFWDAVQENEKMRNPSIPTTRMTKKKTFLHQPADDRGATYWRKKTTRTTSP